MTELANTGDPHVEARLAAHELLVRLAGRLPDELLWRLRDWLAADARASLAAVLPRALLRHRVGVTDTERDLLVTAVGGWGAARRVLDAVLPLGEPDPPPYRFRADADLDPAALVLAAVVPGRAGATEMRQSTRTDGRRTCRVVLVHCAEQGAACAATELPALTATLQRVLRAQGDPSPRVEVLPPRLALPAYHRAALLDSLPLWRTDTAAPTGALVGT